MNYIRRQYDQVVEGGLLVLKRKINNLYIKFLSFLILPLMFPTVLLIRLICIFFIIRFKKLEGYRIGHFLGFIEIYLCEKKHSINIPKKKYIDLFCVERPICNYELVEMYKRVLSIWPVWILDPLIKVNRLLPKWQINDIGNNTQNDRDVNNLLHKSDPVFKFTLDEIKKGNACLRFMGIPEGSPFVCLIVRDSAYLDSCIQKDWSHHNYRDGNIANYVLAAEELARRGFFVIRMGAKMKAPLKSKNPKIIDYAFNGMRTEFMDIYLGSRCEFCISTGTGWDAVPGWMFRKPLLLVNLLPLHNVPSWSEKFIFTTKRMIDTKTNNELSLSETIEKSIQFFGRPGYRHKSSDIEFIETTPEEIRDAVVEMVERLAGIWKPHENDEALQRRFWEIFPTNILEESNKRPLHGKINARFGADFLRNNKGWLK